MVGYFILNVRIRKPRRKFELINRKEEKKKTDILHNKFCGGVWTPPGELKFCIPNIVYIQETKYCRFAWTRFARAFRNRPQIYTWNRPCKTHYAAKNCDRFDRTWKLVKGDRSHTEERSDNNISCICNLPVWYGKSKHRQHRKTRPIRQR